MPQFRDRVIEQRTMKASDLMDHPMNWKDHTAEQTDLLTSILTEIGIADGLLAYHSERNGGKLTLINGHLRRSLDEDQEWRVNITDLNDQEADLLLSIYDPMANLAKINAEKYRALSEQIVTGEWQAREFVHSMEIEANEAARQAQREAEKPSNKEKAAGIEQMELLPFEHYDYVVLMFKNELDWQAAVETLNLRRQSDPRKTGRVGLARVVDGAKVINMIKGLQHGDKVVDVSTLVQ